MAVASRREANCRWCHFWGPPTPFSELSSTSEVTLDWGNQASADCLQMREILGNWEILRMSGQRGAQKSCPSSRSFSRVSQGWLHSTLWPNLQSVALILWFWGNVRSCNCKSCSLCFVFFTSLKKNLSVSRFLSDVLGWLSSLYSSSFGYLTSCFSQWIVESNS